MDLKSNESMANTHSEDLKTIAKNTGFSGIAQLLNILLRYLYAVICTRLLGASAYGLFVLGRTTAQVAALVSQWGMGMAVERQVAHYSEIKQNYKISTSIYIGLRFPLVTSVLFSLLLYLLSGPIAGAVFHKPELAQVLQLLSISVPLLALLNVYLGIFQGVKRVTFRVVIEYLLVHPANILFIGLLGLLLLKLKAVIAAFILANLASLVAAVLLYRKLDLPRHKKGSMKKDTIREVFRFATPAVLTSLLHFLQGWTDTLMLGILSTGFAVGIYNVALRMGAFVSIPLRASNMIFSPMIGSIYARGEMERLKKNYQTVTKMIFTLSLPVFGIIFLFPRELLSVFGRDFVQARTALLLVCLGQLLNACVGAGGRILYMTGRPMVNLFNAAVFLTVTIGLNLLLIPRYQVVGAAVANAVTLGLVNIIRVLQIYKYIRMHPFRWDFLKPLAAFAAGTAVIHWLKEAVSLNIFSLILLAALLVVIYFLLLRLMGITAEEKELLTQVKQSLLRVKK